MENVFEITDEKEAKDFLSHQKATDVWTRCKTSDIGIIELYNNPICIDQIKKSLKMEHISDEAVQGTMESLKLCVSYPTRTKFETRPLRETAFKPLCERAGIGGRTLSCFEDKSTQKEMDPKVKALIFNECLKCYSNKSLVLLRDDKVSAILSGDEADYQIMPVADLQKILETSLETFFSDVSFEVLTMSYELAMLEYRLKDEELQKEMLSQLQAFGINASSVSAHVKLVTSDVGISGANLYPVLVIDGRRMLLGKPIATLHKGVHALEKYAVNCGKLFSLFKESTQRLAELQKIRIKYPAGCLKALGCNLKLPKKAVLLVADTMQGLTSCTGYDIYMNMFDVVDQHCNDVAAKGKELSPTMLMQIQEQAAASLYLEMNNFDYPFNWE